jgi:cbb3-type cytochrome oxidase subunit 3
MDNEMPPESERLKRAETVLKLAEYHNKAMQSRRTVIQQALLAVIAFVGATLINAKALALGTPSLVAAKVLITMFLVLLLAAFLFSVYKMESRNHDDRRKYLTLEAEAWKLIESTRWEQFYPEFKGRSSDYVPAWTWAENATIAWSTSWPGVLVVYISMCTALYVWNL